MCSCNKGKQAARYVVTYSNGSTETARSLVAAKLKVGASPGATYAPETPAPAPAPAG